MDTTEISKGLEPQFIDPITSQVRYDEVTLEQRQAKLRDKPKIISLYAPAPASGKSEVASILTAEFGYTLVKFAAPIKDLLTVILQTIGVPDVDIHAYIEGNRKFENLPGLGVTPRVLMQKIGTEWGRTQDPELWTKLAMRKVQEHLAAGRNVVCDDMRFPNEWEIMRDAGAIMWRVERPFHDLSQATNGHASEGQLDRFKPHKQFNNVGTLDDLHKSVRAALEGTK